MPYYIKTSSMERGEPLRHKYDWPKHVKATDSEITLSYYKINEDETASLMRTLKERTAELRDGLQYGVSPQNFSVLGNCHTLKKLEIRSVLLLPTDIESLSQIFSKLPIQSLSLMNCGIGDDCMKLISTFLLASNQTLTSVNFSYNNITNNGLFYLKEALLKSKIVEIDMDNNKITDHATEVGYFASSPASTECGAVEFFKQLSSKAVAKTSQPQTHIKVVHMQNNPITLAGLEECAKEVEKDQYLTEVKLENSTLTGDAIAWIAYINKHCGFHSEIEKWQHEESSSVLGEDGIAH